MKSVLVFAGTTEGRQLAEIFDRSSIPCHVAVATEYGKDILNLSERITVHSGRLDEQAMTDLIKSIGCEIVVDATHPYSSIVTDTIKKSCVTCSTEYLRLLRENNVDIEGRGISYYDSVEDCIDGLKKTDGNILLTTGSKQIPIFASDESIRRRIIARVLPSCESLEICSNSGLEGKQIIAVQGPFSEEMNRATINEYNIKHLVTRQSGTVGGADTKLKAAIAEGIETHIIKRPNETELHSEEKMNTFSLEQVLNVLENKMNCTFKRGELAISLVGIGPGSAAMMTEEVKNAIQNADILFGAKRMLDSVQSNADRYEYYLKDDIIPNLEDIQKNIFVDKNAVVLFSGDTGFYSGCRKLYDALKEEGYHNLFILPGVSSITVLCSRLGIDWQDGRIISLHGKSEEMWSLELIDSVKYNNKSFFITSGAEDIRKLGQLLEDNSLADVTIKLGYSLSYNDEKVMVLTADECREITENGLYTGVILNENPESKYLVPVMSDEDFLRDKVPMTKEEIRKLSICQLRVKENDIIYDIGSGTGSIAVQIAALSNKVKVYAVECEETAATLTRKNAAKAGLKNVTVINSKAPDSLSELPKADACFIGGSKGNLKEILTKLSEINSKMRIVMNAVSIESICEMTELIKTMKITELSVEQVAVSKIKEFGDYHMMSANNPVFIFSFTLDL